MPGKQIVLKLRNRNNIKKKIDAHFSYFSFVINIILFSVKKICLV